MRRRASTGADSQHVPQQLGQARVAGLAGDAACVHLGDEVEHRRVVAPHPRLQRPQLGQQIIRSPPPQRPVHDPTVTPVEHMFDYPFR